MMETMGKPDKDLDEAVKHILDDVQKRIDEAYQRGHKEGYAKGFEEGTFVIGGDYQRGLDDAWEAARKLSWAEKYGGYGDRLDKVFDRTDTFDFLEYSPNEAIEKLKAYEEKQKVDELKAGDIVDWSGDKYIVSYINEDGCADLIYIECGSTCERVSPDCFTRTGKHYDIEKILEELRT